MYVQMEESMEVPGYERIRCTVAARERTGFMRGSLLLSCGMVTFRSSFFCATKVHETRSAFARFGSLYCNSRVPAKKRMSRMRASFVLRWVGALTYSQERQAQKNAAMDSILNAFW